MDPARLIVHPPASGTWNMAVDEAILEATERNRHCTLRFYQWCEPTLSLGYFQAHAGRESHPDSRSCPLVRRSTGGGAILHDIELTYSFTCPLAERAGSKSQQLYQVFHNSLIHVLAEEFGISASLCQPEVPTTTPPFMCFQRRTQGDVVIESWKVAGSAQRRRRGAILQHGSVLLAASNNATDLPGIREVVQFDLRPNDLIEPWARAISNELQLSWRDSALSQREVDVAREAERLRFASQNWTKKR